MPSPPSDLQAEIRALRRDLHRHPELSNDEHRTQATLEAALSRLGLASRRVAGTGLVAEVAGDPEGPCVCIRGDIDALPLREDTGLPFASENAGVMHACGHDIHAAAAWGAAALLLRDPPPGRVRLLFQPAEERGRGARACVRDGALEGVQAVIGGHVDLGYEVGHVALQEGPICASTDHFRLTVLGRGGHGARPHQGVDALLVAAGIVVALQAIVAREVDPGEPAVVTVGTMQAGDAHNILAGRAVLEGTLRAQSPAVRAQLERAVHRVAKGIASAAGAVAEVDVTEGNGPVVNDPALTAIVGRRLEAVLGPGRVGPLTTVNMGGEDFSDLHADRPGVFLRWGARGPDAGPGPAHSPQFRPDEGVLEVATTTLAAGARAVIDHLRGA